MANWLHPFRALKHVMPRGLFGRSLLIIVLPMILLQAVVTSVFFDRHYRIVTAVMTRGVANDIGYMVMLENRLSGAERERERQLAADIFGYRVEFLPGQRIARAVSEPNTMLDRQLTFIFSNSFAEAVGFDTQRIPDYVDLRIEVRDGVLRLLIPRDRVTVSNADMFLVWMIGSSLVLILIAVLFLRNQIKPIAELAFAAESFGKGRAVPDFKPHGAAEVRRASSAFIDMRERIERHVQQRTEMLAGVSHDLRTPLTRMRLQLAMMKKDADTEAMAADVAEMERMVHAYLEFARGQEGETPVDTDLASLVEECVGDAMRARNAKPDAVTSSLDRGIVLPVRRDALKRCIVNLVDNALKYGSRAEVALTRGDHAVVLNVDDAGPGIPEARVEEAFRPFRRLDESRNLQTGGVGLGLTIARDVARAHGGDVTLEKSPFGGLRAVLRLPV